MRFLFLFFFAFTISCDYDNKTNSFWNSQKKNFHYNNKKEFVSDSVLRAEFDTKLFKKIKHKIFDTTCGSPVYLYSFQDRYLKNYEFTVIKDNDERGLQILYFTLDNIGKLISWTQVAGRGLEGGYRFETRSKFISRDTILNIAAITQTYDFEKNRKLSTTKGDSTFAYFTIDKSGKFKESIFKEIREINFGVQ
jgi:hypothetical protein